jgi:protein JSN1
MVVNEQNNSPNGRIRSQTVSGSGIPEQSHYVPSQQQYVPFLQDDFDLSQLSIMTNFENPNLGPQKSILIDNIPLFVDSVKLYSIMNNSLNNQRNFGAIKSVRLANATNSKLALIECINLDVAMALKASLNHCELAPGITLYVAFAKLADDNVNVSKTPPKQQSQSQPLPQSQPSSQPQSHPQSQAQSQSSHSQSNTKSEPVKPVPTDLASIQASLLDSIANLTNTPIDVNKIVSIINKSIAYSNDNYQDNFGPLPDPIPLRQFDSPKLRELRKILENTESMKDEANEEPADSEIETFSQLQLEELCLAMLDELPELCYDYLGNTIVQKLFTLVESPLIKLMMVKEISPYLTQLSIHKNGTWAIQKIINVCHDDYQQKYLIGASLKPYGVKLFNDQFGNYVIQGCIKFGSPFNDFIFEVIADNFLEISFGRFGARCIRTILETANDGTGGDSNSKPPSFITPEQVMLVAGLIVEFCNELVVNSNGSLLVTWFLDTFNCFETNDRRFELVVRKFLGNLETLCSHKLANLTILKILNNRYDSNSKQAIMDSIFGNFHEYEMIFDEEHEVTAAPTRLLEAILSETPDNNGAGPLFIYKILSNPLLLTLNENDMSKRNRKYHEFVVNQIKRVLLEVNISNMQPYKKLMDEVGLPTSRLNRSGSIGGRRNKKVSGNGGSHQANNGIKPHNQPVFGNGTMYNGSQGYNNGNSGFNGTSNYTAPPPFPMSMNYGQSQQMMMNPPPVASQLGYQQQFPVGMNYQPQQVNQPINQQLPPPTQQRSVPGQSSGGQVYPQQMYQYFSPQPQQPQHQQHQHQQDQDVMQQLEQLSLSSAALGYNSNPGTPSVSSSQRNQFI